MPCPSLRQHQDCGHRLYVVPACRDNSFSLEQQDQRISWDSLFIGLGLVDIIHSCRGTRGGQIGSAHPTSRFFNCVDVLQGDCGSSPQNKHTTLLPRPLYELLRWAEPIEKRGFLLDRLHCSRHKAESGASKVGEVRKLLPESTRGRFKPAVRRT